MPCGQRPRNWPRLACSVGFVARRELRRRSFQYLIPHDGHVGDGISLRFAQLQMSSQLLIPGQLIRRYSRMFYWSQTRVQEYKLVGFAAGFWRRQIPIMGTRSNFKLYAGVAGCGVGFISFCVGVINFSYLQSFEETMDLINHGFLGQ